MIKLLNERLIRIITLDYISYSFIESWDYNERTKRHQKMRWTWRSCCTVIVSRRIRRWVISPWVWDDRLGSIQGRSTWAIHCVRSQVGKPTLVVEDSQQVTQQTIAGPWRWRWKDRQLVCHSYVPNEKQCIINHLHDPYWVKKIVR